ncbi:hypothetical protein EG327_005519 [Venturia inaequalis]|uniref:Uncharacterized protein n=1 Tax=Venturia inaequalis TaxID=5025 RepID=A0A8H3ZBF4_VENIN|nr:hypothetical protein EG327_005519 [Venturia inaequalis]
MSAKSATATTGPSNPLHTFSANKLSSKETTDLEKAQKESDAAYAEYKKLKDTYTEAQKDGTSKEKVDEMRERMYGLEEEARAKEQLEVALLSQLP